MMALREYATGTGGDIIIPIIKAGSDDFAVGGDWTPVAGDVKVSKDGGASGNIGTLPVFVADIGWKFVFSDAELTAARVNINIVDSATKAIKDQHIIIDTYGNASAQHAFNLNTATQTVASVVGNVDGSIGSLGATAKSDVNAEVDDVINVDTHAELAVIPAKDAPLGSKITLMAMATRNGGTATATVLTIHKDDASDLGSGALSDVAGTFSRGKVS